ncbi:hypothetical protein [Acetomicrobium sp.]|uniref:hypothetical protein n=1 Tax=Acetomicrobium sp. TaxID=1872099 RepID=UPI003D977DA1
MTFNILVINPGSTSTKIAWYKNDAEVWTKTIRHSLEELSKFDNVIKQLDFRLGAVEGVVKEMGYSYDMLDAIIGRGGIVDPPMPGGVYQVEEVLIEHLENVQALGARFKSWRSHGKCHSWSEKYSRLYSRFRSNR